jgi:uncharacterized lipoprotein NlpE involved in copper resistance
MERRGSRPVAVVAAIAALSAAFGLVACGDDDSEQFSDRKIVDALGLEETDGAYAMGGDPFCQVSNELLNDSSEVQDAGGREERSLVIASAEGNVGVEGVAPFASDCQREAKQDLNELDPRRTEK